MHTTQVLAILRRETMYGMNKGNEILKKIYKNARRTRDRFNDHLHTLFEFPSISILSIVSQYARVTNQLSAKFPDVSILPL